MRAGKSPCLDADCRQQPPRALVHDHHDGLHAVDASRQVHSVIQRSRSEEPSRAGVRPHADRRDVPGTRRIEPRGPCRPQPVDQPGRARDIVERLQSRLGRGDQPARRHHLATRPGQRHEDRRVLVRAVLDLEFVECVPVGAEEHLGLAPARGGEHLARGVEDESQRRRRHRRASAGATDAARMITAMFER